MEYLIGGVMIFIGTITLTLAAIMHFMFAKKTSGEPVDLLVTDIVERRDRDGDITFAPHYLVLRGPHEGKRFENTTGSSPALHKKNDYVKGTINPETGEIASLREGVLLKWIPVLCAAAGVALVGLGAWYIAQS